MQDFDNLFTYLRYELVEQGRVAVITLDRPKQRNAQNRGILVELGSAFELAEADDTVRVVIRRGAGPSFSAGHDLGSSDDVRERAPGPDALVDSAAEIANLLPDRFFRAREG